MNQSDNGLNKMWINVAIADIAAVDALNLYSSHKSFCTVDRNLGQLSWGTTMTPGSMGLASSGGIGLPHANPPPAELVADLRTDHAGETGAVLIYRGILAARREAALRSFAQEHLATEAKHLVVIEQWLEPRHHSRLLPLWRLAGWLTGALPALLGPQAVYATIEAVETFVDHHYTEQIESIDRLDPDCADAPLQALRTHLQSFRADEVGHRDHAAARLDNLASPPSPMMRL